MQQVMVGGSFGNDENRAIRCATFSGDIFSRWFPMYCTPRSEPGKKHVQEVSCENALVAACRQSSESRSF